MKTFTHSKLALLAVTLTSSIATSSALADYRLTAFSDTPGFMALVKEDLTETKAIFESRSLKNMDYFEANNLCVAQILLGEYDAAISSCSTALKKSEYSSELTYGNEKIALASVYSNLAVAKAMSGDAAGANIDLETALSLNEKDGNANLNYDLLSTNFIAGS